MEIDKNLRTEPLKGFRKAICQSGRFSISALDFFLSWAQALRPYMRKQLNLRALRLKSHHETLFCAKQQAIDFVDKRAMEIVEPMCHPHANMPNCHCS